MDDDDRTLNVLIGEAVRTMREKSGLSMRELARRAGVSQPFLSQIERGVSAPSMVTIYRLADALDILPGALLPALTPSRVTVVRADEGRAIPVANRDDAAVGRAILMQPANPLEVIEYRISPGQYVEEWFSSPGELGLYLVSGVLEVDVEGHPSVRLHSGDFVTHPASIRHRWRLVDGEPAHVVMVIAHPGEGGPALSAASR
ncbi:XRE family transcriptional regulator [Mycolicibacterium sp. CH28]|uniref:helix-turn-helix domain-containing protein n=1 Tax=Mycolicibacterium sp. CH28 TaxID=2512237 RepID=UPI0010814FA7|nr:XRE family transcriptional regulator [Mycolicibacterium sp. CH28]TGD85444.1 XRE family transcriptional regulator [Mycolicibacterium sp. CH28]